MSVKGKAYIGTSGWNYQHWRERFYPKDLKVKDQFAYYQRFFDTVEMNNPFYKLPERSTFEKWKQQTTKDFVFSVKANRFITHMKKLKDAGESLDRMLTNASGLGKKLGPLLFQLPPGWNRDTERLESFLKLLPKKLRPVFEFRNEDWYHEEVYQLLEKYNCAFCIYELAGHLSPVKVTADFVYIRLHGPGAKYQGSYTTKALQSWARKCRSWLRSGKDVYVYFDNDQLGYAPKNAIALREMLGQGEI